MRERRAVRPSASGVRGVGCGVGPECCRSRSVAKILETFIEIGAPAKSRRKYPDRGDQEAVMERAREPDVLHCTSADKFNGCN